MELTHASFFSGVGGLDLGLERAGWRTVSFSEIDPYASAVLAERWPGVPNVGDINAIAASVRPDDGASLRRKRRQSVGAKGREWHRATLWSGGFPCQDLSVAGKRKGFDGDRSVLAFTFLDLVERHRPPAILLENVPGLLSSNGGKDFGRLVGEVGELGYWWAYRILDAQFFGVPQRRRRVFICALDSQRGFGADSAAAVLSVGTRCDGHSATGDEAGEGTAEGTTGSPDGPGRTFSVGSVRAWYEGISSLGSRDWKSTNHIHISPSPDSGGVRAADGLAGRLDDLDGRLNGKTANAEVGVASPRHPTISPTLTAPDTRHRIQDGKRQDGSRLGRIPTIIQSLDTKRGGVDDNEAQAGHLVPGLQSGPEADGVLLPLGFDSHRYRCCGNGVVSNVSEWVGRRLRRAIEGVAA